ncbi:DinB family protein [Deinococcus hohokamensis]|uniref:DinB family protein n=1 Tax=Deinococcus hohokamensis TaxID=309883 RepID=A0ABV9IAV5_9DEIO
MEFRLEEGMPVLRATPGTLRALLQDLPDPWVHANEGPQTWSPFEVVGHLVMAEQQNWRPRLQSLWHGEGTFPPFDRFAHLGAHQGRSLDELLDEFRRQRAESLELLEALKLTPQDLSRTGKHPEFGAVTLGQLLATWVTHDLSHLVQVSRTLARQYRAAVGPWQAYLSVLQGP